MTDLKRKLIEEINKIEDTLIIEQLTSLIKESDQTIEVKFSESQLNKIKESQFQIKDGKFHNHNDVMEMINND